MKFFFYAGCTNEKTNKQYKCDSTRTGFHFAIRSTLNFFLFVVVLHCDFHVSLSPTKKTLTPFPLETTNALLCCNINDYVHCEEWERERERERER